MDCDLRMVTIAKAMEMRGIIERYTLKYMSLKSLLDSGIITLDEYHKEHTDTINEARKELELDPIPKWDEGKYCVGADYATDNSEAVVTVLEKVRDGFVVRGVASFPTLTGMKQVLAAITE